MSEVKKINWNNKDELNEYMKIKMREWRARHRNELKEKKKKYKFCITIDGVNYVFNKKKDIKIRKISKESVKPNYKVLT